MRDQTHRLYTSRGDGPRDLAPTRHSSPARSDDLSLRGTTRSQRQLWGYRTDSAFSSRRECGRNKAPVLGSHTSYTEVASPKEMRSGLHTINSRLRMDCRLAAPLYGKKGISREALDRTWIGVLRDNDSPLDWRSRGVLVGIAPDRTNGRSRGGIG
jgi:hypothetical protein